MVLRLGKSYVVRDRCILKAIGLCTIVNETGFYRRLISSYPYSTHDSAKLRKPFRHDPLTRGSLDQRSKPSICETCCEFLQSNKIIYCIYEDRVNAVAPHPNTISMALQFVYQINK